MSDRHGPLDYRPRPPYLPLHPVGEGRAAGTTPDDGTESCPAFGYLRGLHERAVSVEFRFRDGNSEWFAYNCLVSWRHDPSVGLLLKFTGDLLSLVLVAGSNLDAPVGTSQINLTDRGLARHRVSYVREMDEEELQRAKQAEPTIDRILIAEFETVEDQRQWLKKHAPAFLRPPE